ncbi:hypothetical protein ACTJJ0_28280 [Chitinophaga sp. 22321]|uniref:Uncharacterized protein n=1 Tax=Chitinophaga hostae TaxID=2831022 RepID=A0ABS5JAX7_9BACT|nr:hypothetical protein [Chitinophaga hostae]MBS0032351.1 hypothetical protein [Chitinophaga hostae]
MQLQITSGKNGQAGGCLLLTGKKAKIVTKIVTMVAAKLLVILYLRKDPQQKFRASYN